MTDVKLTKEKKVDVETAKYKQGLTADEFDLVKDFNAAFKKSFDLKTIQKLLGNAQIRPWYATWKLARSSAKALPEQFSHAGLTPLEWAEIQKVQRDRSEIRRQAAEKMMIKAKQYAQDILDIQSDTFDKLASKFSKLTDINEGGYRELEIDEVAMIESAEKSLDRAALLTALKARAKCRWVLRYRLGLPPCGPIPSKAWCGEKKIDKYTEHFASYEKAVQKSLEEALKEFNAQRRLKSEEQIITFPELPVLVPVDKDDDVYVDRAKQTRETFKNQPWEGSVDEERPT